jgi:DNA-binding GntR family transcriptional regulator
MLKVQKPVDLVDVVKDAIFEAVLTGRFKPGDRLHQDMLAELLGVSRQPVSHALRMLTQFGVLAKTGGKSLVVTGISKTQLQQLVDVRIQIDGYAAKLAALRHRDSALSEQDLAVSSEINDLMARNKGASAGDLKSAVLDDIRFHRCVRILSGNPYLEETIAPHLLHHHRLMYMVARNPGPRIWNQHQQIIDAVRIGDAASAFVLVEKHITDGINLLLANWPEGENTPA